MSAGRNPKKPILTKQNSSDLANEEWETASESSDVLDRRDRDPKNELRDPGSRDREKERREVKKSFSSQRPVSDRQNRRANSAEARHSMERGRGPGKERSPNSVRSNGSGSNKNSGSANNKNNKTAANLNRKENVNTVYTVGQMVPQDPTAIQNAINSLSSKTKTKKSDLTDVSKPLKTEKKDALANIDINNYASK